MANVQNIDDPEIQAQIHFLLNKDESCLAPLLDLAIGSGLKQARMRGADAVIAETCRCQALQDIYLKCGTTHAASVWRAWHVYGLAVDVISQASAWAVYPSDRGPGDVVWCEIVRSCFEAAGLKGGYQWTSFKDYPHWQWGLCRATPSDLSLNAYKQGGNPAVWKLVHAA